MIYLYEYALIINLWNLALEKPVSVLICENIWSNIYPNCLRFELILLLIPSIPTKEQCSEHLNFRYTWQTLVLAPSLTSPECDSKVIFIGSSTIAKKTNVSADYCDCFCSKCVSFNRYTVFFLCRSFSLPLICQSVSERMSLLRLFFSFSAKKWLHSKHYVELTNVNVHVPYTYFVVLKNTTTWMINRQFFFHNFELIAAFSTAA